MKKSIFTLLLLSIFSLLFPFGTFSATTFTSSNPIVLPTTTTTTTTNTYNDNNDRLHYSGDPVRDDDGDPIRIGAEYFIYSTDYRGDVYLSNVEGSDSKCPNGISVPAEKGTPVKFETTSLRRRSLDQFVTEGLNINIKFSIPTTTSSSSSCVNETLWKADNPDWKDVDDIQTAGFFVTGRSYDTKNTCFHIGYADEEVPGLYTIAYLSCDREFEGICPGQLGFRFVGVDYYLRSKTQRLLLSGHDGLLVMFRKVSKG